VTDVLTYKTDDMDLEDDDEETNESYKLPEQTTIGEITDPTLVGTYDYAMSDGSFVSRYRTLTEEQKKECVGIVFWTAAESKYGLTIDDPILLDEHSDCTHGLIVALEELGTMSMLSSEVSVYDSFQNNNNDLADYESILGGTAEDGYKNANRMLGYNNTQVLKKFNLQYKDKNKCLPVAALDNLEDIKDTSGWYIPSVRELSLLSSGEQYTSVNSNNTFFGDGSCYGSANITKIDDLIYNITGVSVSRNDSYGSSTEAPYKVWDDYFWWSVWLDGGEVQEANNQAEENRPFVAICAF
jgi:hypothetical protein